MTEQQQIGTDLILFDLENAVDALFEASRHPDKAAYLNQYSERLRAASDRLLFARFAIRENEGKAA